MIENIVPKEKVCDLCVVGTGPVGMALAMEFERLGDEVFVLESGGREVDPSDDRGFAGTDRGFQAPRSDGNCSLQGLGGHVVGLERPVRGL